MTTPRQVGPNSILITTTVDEIEALANGEVLRSLLGRARSWRLQDDVTKIVESRSDPEAWTMALREAVSRRVATRRSIYYNQHGESWLVSDRIGSTLVPFAPAGPTVTLRHEDLTLASLDFAKRPHVGHAALDTFWEAALAAVKLDHPDTPLVLRTADADVVVNGAFALVWVACAYTAAAVGQAAIRVSFSRCAEWFMSQSWSDGKKLAPPVKFECSEDGCSWLAPLRTRPTESDPVLDLRGAL